MKPMKFVKVPKKQIKVALSHGIRKVGYTQNIEVIWKNVF
jgi:hypothetical protein